MPLIAKVQERISAQQLVELTNQGVPTAIVVDLVKLQLAVDDTEAVFLVETGVAYDDLDPLHIATAVQGVRLTLMEWTGITGRNTEQLASRYRKALILVAQTRGGEKRLLAETTSTLEPTVQASGSRPDGDREVWRDYTFDSPNESDDHNGRLGLGL